MNLVPAITSVPPLTTQESFLDQCVALGQTIFSRLQGLILNPGENQKETDSAIANLETASRILKRIQESYMLAQKALAAKFVPQPAHLFSTQSIVERATDSKPAPQPSMPGPTNDADNSLGFQELSNALKAQEDIAWGERSAAPGTVSSIPPSAESATELRIEDLGEGPLDANPISSDAPPETAPPAHAPALSALSPAPGLRFPVRPPLTRKQRNQKKAAKRQAKGKR